MNQGCIYEVRKAPIVHCRLACEPGKAMCPRHLAQIEERSVLPKAEGRTASTLLAGGDIALATVGATLPLSVEPEGLGRMNQPLALGAGVAEALDRDAVLRLAGHKAIVPGASVDAVEAA